ncbi:MAG: DUF4143 domain-containing protein [Candidatus Saccharibacteria bacterium]|nr:DUF4143 domain-containing protein [Candidatus Saccharibacteria bacterium]
MDRVYQSRIADAELRQKLVVGAVLIKGPKWCGKTWTAEEQANSFLLMDDPDHKEQNIALAKNSPRIALEGDTPRLIDEWQLVPKLWDAVRFEVDKRGKPAQFILTGSAVPADMSEVDHSGTGRIATLLMRPMSLFESGESDGSVSLSELFNSPSEISGTCPLGLKKLAFVCCRGGWPKSISYTDNDALTLSKAYYDGLIENDISRVDRVKRNSVIASRILRSYARFQGQQATFENIKKDTAAGDGIPVGIDTVYDYTDAFRKLFVIEDSPAWNPNLRSKSAIRTSDTRYFVDPSIATQALGVSPDDLIQDLHTFGFIFETLCIRDLRIYAESIGKHVSHYRDSSGLECDAVIHSQDGKYGLIQIKLGSDDETIEDASGRLKDLEEVLDDTTMSKPAFKMVLVGNAPYAYLRRDGVYVVPIGCLKP